MEQQSNPNQGRTSLVSEDFEWYWQAHSNASQEWTKYSPFMKQIIEASYNKKEATVDLGDHLIFFTQMIQVSKFNIQEQKKVKRVALNRKSSPREQRFTNQLPLKALDKTFGSSKEFLAYVSAKIGDSVYQNNEAFWLVPCTLENLGFSALKCITNKCKKNGSGIDRAIIQNIEKEIKKAIRNEEYEKIYRVFLQTYTEECFLYRLIDRLLVEEDWKGLEEWSSYLIILASAFISMQESYSSQVNKNIPTTLYRGTQLIKEDFKEYDSSKNRYFSWNTFTSTTKSKSIAQNFSREQDTIPVLFEIDTRGDDSKNQLLDLERISSFANELEVLIAPGTIFELLETRHQDDLCIMNLRIVPMSEVATIPTLQLQNGKLHLEIMQKRIQEKGNSLKFHGKLDGFSLSQIGKAIMHNQILKELTWMADIIADDQENGALDFCKAISTTSIKHISIASEKVNILKSLQYSPSLNSLYIEVWRPQLLEPFAENLVKINVPHINLKLYECPYESLGLFVSFFKDPAWKWKSLEVYVSMRPLRNPSITQIIKAFSDLDIQKSDESSSKFIIRRKV